MTTALMQVGAWFVAFGLICGVGGCSMYSGYGEGAVVGVCGWLSVVVGAILFSCGALLAELRGRRGD